MNQDNSRRSFLKTTTAGAIAAGGAPSILGAYQKSGSEKMMIGTGDHTYEVQHDWGELPDRIKYGNTHGIVEDSDGRFYVFHTVNKNSVSTDAMVVFDAKGKFITSWGS